MIIYAGVKSDFLLDVEHARIAEIVEKNILERMGRRTGMAEFRSWENSLQAMYLVLQDRSVPEDAGIAIEYNVPQTSKRVDFIISGLDHTGHAHVVIIELKQWDRLETVEGVDALVHTFTGGRLQDVVHPSYQAWSYAELIADYNTAVQDDHIDLHPCAYLHNYRRAQTGTDPLDDELYTEYLEAAPAFSKGDAVRLRNFIRQYVCKGDRGKTLYEIEGGKIRPSKKLQDALLSMLQGNRAFCMVDEQKVAYERILKQATCCYREGKKQTIIVRGGPGTGKSVIAINLMVELTRRNMVVQYTSKNSAPREVYRRQLTGRRLHGVNNLFNGSGSYTTTEENTFDVLLADEAHRLNEKSGMFHNLGENQVKEIIHASRCSVFFLDESQRVTMNDIGSEEEIRRWAEAEGSNVCDVLELTSQFRCNGSDGYLAWLDNALDIRETAYYRFEGIDYDFRVCDSPQEMLNLIREKNRAGGRSRVIAGYCWEWPTGTRNDANFPDIVIGDFGMSWNLENYTFALDDRSIDQAGCIHTTQGLEFDYVGILIGEDLRYVNGRVVTDYTKRAHTDQSLRGLGSLIRKDPAAGRAKADELIKNTYRTIMTRGMKGCYIYCCDEALADYFRAMLPEETPIVPEILEPVRAYEERDGMLYVPVVGAIAAGYGRITEENYEGLVATPRTAVNSTAPGKYFYLRIVGDSMIDAGIHEGDLVLIRRMSNMQDVHNGDQVACRVRGDSATLKTFYREKGRIRLQPENKNYEPIYVYPDEFEMGDAQIIGVMKEKAGSDEELPIG